MDYYREHNLKIKIIRIFNTFGPNMAKNDGRVISNFIIQAIRNDEITIEFKIYLDEMNKPTKIELSENNSDLNYTEKKLSKLAFNALENSKFISTSKLNETSIYFKKIKFPENFCTW